MPELPASGLAESSGDLGAPLLSSGSKEAFRDDALCFLWVKSVNSEVLLGRPCTLACSELYSTAPHLPHLSFPWAVSRGVEGGAFVNPPTRFKLSSQKAGNTSPHALPGTWGWGCGFLLHTLTPCLASEARSSPVLSTWGGAFISSLPNRSIADCHCPFMAIMHTCTLKAYWSCYSASLCFSESSACPTKPTTRHPAKGRMGFCNVHCQASKSERRLIVKSSMSTFKKVPTFNCMGLEWNILLFLHDECTLKVISQVSLF